MQLASVNDLIDRFDVRELGQLASDTNTQLTALQLQTATPVLAALDDASGIVLSALYVAYRYLPTDISALDDQSAAMLKRISCDLAFVYMAQRRGYSFRDKYPLIQDSYDLLQKLRNGERILNVASVEEGGLTQVGFVTAANQAIAGMVTVNPAYFPSCNCN